MFHQFGKEMNFSWHQISCTLGDPRCLNQGIKSLQLFSVLYVVEHFYVEGEVAPCEGKFFVLLAAFPVFHSTTQS